MTIIKTYTSLILFSRIPREKLFFNERSYRRQASLVKVAKVLS